VVEEDGKLVTKYFEIHPRDGEVHWAEGIQGTDIYFFEGVIARNVDKSWYVPLVDGPSSPSPTCCNRR
jgi:hypothetical protein